MNLSEEIVNNQKEREFQEKREQEFRRKMLFAHNLKEYSSLLKEYGDLMTPEQKSMLETYNEHVEFMKKRDSIEERRIKFIVKCSVCISVSSAVFSIIRLILK